MKGEKIGVAANRNAEAICTLIQKSGGKPSVFSIQGEQILNEHTSKQNVMDLINNPFDLILLTTGIGAETLEKAAADQNQLDHFIDKLRSTPLAVRGSKTMKWLKKHDLSAAFVSEDGTMENLLKSIASSNTARDRVFLQAYNQDDALLKQKLQELGYTVYLSKPYQYREPHRDTLINLRQEIINQSLDAVIFTSKSQVQNLFQKTSNVKAIRESFNNHVLAVAVGKVTASELKHNGVSNVWYPPEPKMGAMVIELRNYFLENSREKAGS